MKGKVKVNNNWKMAYILYKVEGIGYEIEKSQKGHVVFWIENTDEVQNALNEWIKIKQNASDELVNIGEYIFYKNLITTTIKSYKSER